MTPIEELIEKWRVNWTHDRPGHSLAMRKCADQLDAAKESIARWYRREALESLALWMTQHGFATGHGDTFEDLLSQLTWQVAEKRNPDERKKDTSKFSSGNL